MSISPDNLPKVEVPNTLTGYSEEEKAHARFVQDSHKGEKAKGNKGHALYLAVGTLAVGAVAGLFFGANRIGLIGGDSSSETPAPNPDKTVSAPAVPGETNDIDTSNPTEFSLSAAEYENNLESLAEKYYAQENKFMIAGISKEVAESEKRFEAGDDVYLKKIVSPINDKFVEDLFVEDWKSKPKLAEYVNGILKLADTTKYARINTYGDYDDEPYERSTITDEIVVDTATSSTTVTWHGYDNRDLNHVEDSLLTGVDPNDEYGSLTISWENVDGKMKIANVSY